VSTNRDRWIWASIHLGAKLNNNFCNPGNDFFGSGLATIVKAVVVHQNCLVFSSDTCLQNFTHKQGMVTLGHLAYDSTLPPRRKAQQQGTARFLPHLKALPADRVALSLVWLEEIEG
jgi:hypothetical protein